ncbi:patatin-like phospholipase family protein [Aureimonas flava]|uniref:Patatin-like phospholipase family protein n=1 Tax=Aureimonas flava TaxID=2320271 RepID=A0A3A1WIV5_9HYPH|nr:patatin-like phospholipase family protein [Aureimonas flava]RIX99593.1 patatin-like phospholipase family protein [Aureimonas flava]
MIPRDPAPASSAPEASIGLALGGGGARGLAHLHVLAAFEDLGLRPARIAGTSIGAIVGAGAASGLGAAAIEDHVLAVLASPRGAFGTLWRTRPPTLAEFRAEGGFRLGQLNAERVVAAFLPPGMPARFEDLGVPLAVIATDFYGGREWPIRSGDLASALGASAALPAIFRPVRRDGLVLVDGGITNPLPFDVFDPSCAVVVASDVTGGPERGALPLPTPVETMLGASQLMMGAVVRAKLACATPDVLIRPPVSSYRVLDFLRARTILRETHGVREEVKRRLGEALEGRAASGSRFPPETA